MCARPVCAVGWAWPLVEYKKYWDTEFTFNAFQPLKEQGICEKFNNNIRVNEHKQWEKCHQQEPVTHCQAVLSVFKLGDWRLQKKRRLVTLNIFLEAKRE